MAIKIATHVTKKKRAFNFHKDFQHKYSEQTHIRRPVTKLEANTNLSILFPNHMAYESSFFIYEIQYLFRSISALLLNCSLISKTINFDTFRDHIFDDYFYDGLKSIM